MSSNSSQGGEGKGEAVFAYGCSGFLFLLFSFVLSIAFAAVAENWSNQAPITFGHLAKVGWFVLVMGLIALAFKLFFDTKLRENLALSFFQAVLLLLAWIATTFLILYLYRGISFADFVSIIRTSPGR